MSELMHQLWWVVRALLAAGLLFGFAAVLRRWSVWLAVVPASLAGVLTVFALTIPAFFFRPRPANENRWLFEGVRYERRVTEEPVHRVSHIVTLDLAQPGLQPFVTPPVGTSTNPDDLQVPARTTSGFAEVFDQQLAINANYFGDQWSYSLLFGEPDVGDPVYVVGRAISDGTVYGFDDRSMKTLWFDGGRAFIGTSSAAVNQAVSGYVLIRNRTMGPAVRRSVRREPRVAVGLDASGRRLLVVLIDGRQPRYSDGASLRELAELMLSEGVTDALMLDGGGSSALVYKTPKGAFEVMNSPVHGRMPPGFERPVANHLGFSGLAEN